MTILVIVKKNNRVCIAADTAVTVNGVTEHAELNERHDKIFKFKDTWFAYTGSSHTSLMLQMALEQHGENLEFGSVEDIYKSLLDLHRILKQHFYLKPESSKSNHSVEDMSLSFLIANPSGIYQFYGDRYVGELSTYWSAGSGSRLALGAMHAVYDEYDDAEAIARAGVEAACKFDQHCALPMTLYSTELALDDASESTD